MTSSSVERVQDALRSLGLEAAVLELSSSTRTAADAAATLGCQVAQIAKSLVFVSDDGRHVLVIVSGANRVDETKLAALVGQSLKRASADQVREMSGFAIGGVPPLAHRQQPAAVLVDEDLLAHDVIWAAAGSPNAVVRLTGSELVSISGGTVVPIKSLAQPSPRDGTRRSEQSAKRFRMKTAREQEVIIRQILSEIFDPAGDLPDDLDISGLLGSLALRRHAAAAINGQARRLYVELDGGWFLGVVTETELQAVRTGAELMSLVLRHVNGQLEDDSWSAF